MPFKSKNLFSKKSSGVLSASQDLNVTQAEASTTQAQEPSFVPVEAPYANSTAFEPQAPTRAASAFDEHGSSPFEGAKSGSIPPVLSGGLPGGGGSAEAFVKRLKKDLELRQGVAHVLQEQVLVGSGDEQVSQWLRDEGCMSTLDQVHQAMEAAKSSDLLFWAACYSLHVQWTPDGSHAWDIAAEPLGSKGAVLLEISEAPGAGTSGLEKGTISRVQVLLNNEPLEGWTFSDGLLRTTTPVSWMTPEGAPHQVHLQLSFSSNFNTTPELDGERKGVLSEDEGGHLTNGLANGHAEAALPASKYVGVQISGMMWPAGGPSSYQDWSISSISSSPAPAKWPMTPVIISGKVNICSKAAAVAGGRADGLRQFAGSYSTTFLRSGVQAPVKGPELIIRESGGRFTTPGSVATVSRGGASSQGPQGSTKPSKPHLQADPETRTTARPNGLLVCLDEHVISKWRFDANNVLAWDGNPAAGSEWTAGWSGWLQFIQVPESTDMILVGNVHKAADLVPEGFNIYGETKGTPSKLLPSGSVSTFLGANVEATVDTAAVLLLGGLMTGAKECWSLLHDGASKQDLGLHHPSLMLNIEEGFGRLGYINQLAERYRLLFKSEAATAAATEGGMHSGSFAGDTSLVELALQRAAEAAGAASAAKAGLDGAEQSLAATRSAEATSNATLAITEAGNTAWRARQTAQAESAAEQQAVGASEAAGQSRSVRAYNAELAAAQSYNLAKQCAIDATSYVLAAASTAMRAVEAEVKQYSVSKDWRKLMYVAAASHVAEQTVRAAEEAQQGWITDTPAGRRAAVEATSRCSELAKQCLKQMKTVESGGAGVDVDSTLSAADVNTVSSPNQSSGVLAPTTPQ